MFLVDWDNLLLSSNTDTSYKTFIEKFQSLLDISVPLKKVSKNKLKFKDKSWITFGLQKSISVKSQYMSKFFRLQDPLKKKDSHIRYKQHKKLLSTLLKK